MNANSSASKKRKTVWVLLGFIVLLGGVFFFYEKTKDAMLAKTQQELQASKDYIRYESFDANVFSRSVTIKNVEFLFPVGGAGQRATVGTAETMDLKNVTSSSPSALLNNVNFFAANEETNQQINIGTVESIEIDSIDLEKIKKPEPTGKKLQDILEGLSISHAKFNFENLPSAYPLKAISLNSFKGKRFTSEAEIVEQAKGFLEADDVDALLATLFNFIPEDVALQGLKVTGWVTPNREVNFSIANVTSTELGKDYNATFELNKMLLTEGEDLLFSAEKISGQIVDNLKEKVKLEINNLMAEDLSFRLIPEETPLIIKLKKVRLNFFGDESLLTAGLDVENISFDTKGMDYLGPEKRALLDKGLPHIDATAHSKSKLEYDATERKTTFVTSVLLDEKTLGSISTQQKGVIVGSNFIPDLIKVVGGDDSALFKILATNYNFSLYSATAELTNRAIIDLLFQFEALQSGEALDKVAATANMLKTIVAEEVVPVTFGSLPGFAAIQSFILKPGTLSIELKEISPDALGRIPMSGNFSEIAEKIEISFKPAQ